MRSPMFVGSAANIMDQRVADIPAANGAQNNQTPTNRSIAQTFALAPQSSGLFVRDARTRGLP